MRPASNSFRVKTGSFVKNDNLKAGASVEVKGTMKGSKLMATSVKITSATSGGATKMDKGARWTGRQDGQDG